MSEDKDGRRTNARILSCLQMTANNVLAPVLILNGNINALASTESERDAHDDVCSINF